MPDNERQFEQDIESFLLSPVGGWQKASDAGYRASMDSGMALDLATLLDFVQATQPIQWQRFEKQCNSNPEKKFYKAFENAVENDGLISVLRHGFKHRGIEFRVCYFKPESTLNDVAVKHYGQNICQCIRQWRYSDQNSNSVDMMLAVKRGLERGETLFHLYGGMGGQRTDHTVANLQALLYLADHGAEGWLHGRGERWTAIRDGSIVFPARPEGILSVFCVGPDAEGVTIRGAQYPLEGATLTASVPLGVSNHFIGQDIMVEVTHGSLLLGLHD
mgnify:CR=1 FL=1